MGAVNAFGVRRKWWGQAGRWGRDQGRPRRELTACQCVLFYNVRIRRDMRNCTRMQGVEARGGGRGRQVVS